MPTSRTSSGWLRGLIAAAVVLASVGSSVPVSWDTAPRAAGYRLCWSVYLQGKIPWWRNSVPHQFWCNRCVETDAMGCETGRCWAPTSLIPDPPPNTLYAFVVTAYNTGGESVTEHGAILDCN